MSSIGMMEGAFFVGRKEILDWINDILDLNLSKIEDTASGCVACQLLDLLYPGKVPMHKVNWSVKQNFEYIANYKILQNCFTALKIDRFIDVDRLISARYMDNLEFMQWFKRFYELNCQDGGKNGNHPNGYDCLAQRSKGKGGATYQFNRKGGPSASSRATASRAIPNSTTKSSSSVASASSRTASAPSRTTVTSSTPTTTTGTTSSTTSSQEILQYQSDIQVLQKELAEVRNSYESSQVELKQLSDEYQNLEKERDFYFEKLRNIEILLQEKEESNTPFDSNVSAEIFNILYATAEGFEIVNPDQDGSLMNTSNNNIDETY